MAIHSIINTNPSQAKDRAFDLLLIISIIIELYLLIFGFPSFLGGSLLDRGNLTEIAQILKTENSVKTQTQGSLNWIDSSSGEQLYLSESVLTLDQSKAEISFLDGTGFVLDQNSLVQLEQPNKDNSSHIVIKLLRGKLQKKAGQKLPKNLELELQIDQTIVQFTPETELVVQHSPELKKTEIQVESGVASLSDGPNLPSIKINPHEEAVLTKTQTSSWKVQTAQDPASEVWPRPWSENKPAPLPLAPPAPALKLEPKPKPIKRKPKPPSRIFKPQIQLEAHDNKTSKKH